MNTFKKMYPSIENTTLCGGNCIMCPRDEVSYQFGNMSFNVFQKIVDELVVKGCRSVAIKGFGDCLCDSGFEEKLEYIKSICPDMFISTINTGHLFTQKNMDIIYKYIDNIKISMYGMTKNTYESVHRGTLVFEDVKSKIDEFLEKKKSKTFVILTFLLLPENCHEMKDWINYYEDKCDRIDVWKPHNWGGKYGIEADEEIIKACPRVMNCFDIQFCADGSVVPCCFDFNRHDVIGNVRDNTIEDILNGEVIERMRKIHRSGNISTSKLMCRNCDQIRERGDALVYSSDKKMNVGEPSLRVKE